MSVSGVVPDVQNVNNEKEPDVRADHSHQLVTRRRVRPLDFGDLTSISLWSPLMVLLSFPTYVCGDIETQLEYGPCW